MDYDLHKTLENDLLSILANIINYYYYGHITMVPALGMVFYMLRCGKIIDSLINTSSLIWTSCATTETPSIRTQWPTTHCQPIIAFRMNAWALISV